MGNFVAPHGHGLAGGSVANVGEQCVAGIATTGQFGHLIAPVPVRDVEVPRLTEIGVEAEVAAAHATHSVEQQSPFLLRLSKHTIVHRGDAEMAQVCTQDGVLRNFLGIDGGVDAIHVEVVDDRRRDSDIGSRDVVERYAQVDVFPGRRVPHPDIHGSTVAVRGNSTFLDLERTFSHIRLEGEEELGGLIDGDVERDSRLGEFFTLAALHQSADCLDEGVVLAQTAVRPDVVGLEPDFELFSDCQIFGIEAS